MKKFICGLVIGSICTLSIGSLANCVWDNISVLKNDINVVVNGETVTADNFLYNDITYLPLRAVSEALGESVNYDDKTNTAYIGLQKNSETITGKYTPPKGMFEKNLVKVFNGQYYLTENGILTYYSDYFDGKNTYVIGDRDTMTFTFKFSDGSTKILPIVLIESIGGYGILYDTFVDEILPLMK